MEKVLFGSHEGKDVHKYVARNRNGMEISMTDYGATIISVKVPNKHGDIEEVTVNYDEFEKVKASRFYGVTVGRYANRIGNAKFSLDGKDYNLPANNKTNSLHGGIIGWSKLVWETIIIENDDYIGFEFRIVSEDGDQGYPGKVEASAVYKLDQNKNNLRMVFSATTDAPTVINMVNHTYWNLSGNYKENIMDHRIHISASNYLPVNEFQIPTGELRPVEDSIMDFSHSRRVGDDLLKVDGGGKSGYDHCYVIDSDNSHNDDISTVYDKPLRHVATLSELKSSIVMDIHSTQPGVQFYTGNWINDGVIPHLPNYGICLETQHFPNSPNTPSFPSTVLRPGKKYTEVTDHTFTVLS